MRACIKCTDRYPACQDSCERFLEYKAQRDEKLERIRKASDKLARDTAISLCVERKRKANR